MHFQRLMENISWLSQQDGAIIRGWKDARNLEILGNEAVPQQQHHAPTCLDFFQERIRNR